MKEWPTKYSRPFLTSFGKVVRDLVGSFFYLEVKPHARAGGREFKIQRWRGSV